MGGDLLIHWLQAQKCICDEGILLHEIHIRSIAATHFPGPAAEECVVHLPHTGLPNIQLWKKKNPRLPVVNFLVKDSQKGNLEIHSNSHVVLHSV